jgi:integrase
MHTETVSTRFERSVDRTGEHHVWTGAIDAVRGTGRLKVGGKNLTAHRVAWEIANGELPANARVLACREEPACVRLDHLRVDGITTTRAPRNRKGGGSMREIRPGVWKFSATARFADGTVRRVHRTVHADGRTHAAKQLASFVDEVDKEDGLVHREHSRMTVDEAIELFLSEHLAEEKGREDKTIRDYRALHRKWFASGIGSRLVREVDKASLDRLFGAMRRAGLSASRMNQARSLYAPFFRWAKERGMTTRDPMANFQLPTSQYVSRERTPPEVEELSVLLAEAVAVIPEIAPVLVLGATSGMRRGELVGIRRSRIDWEQRRITVDAAIDGKRVKGTKTRKERSFYVDDETMALLHRLCEQRDLLAVTAGVALDPDPFLFSLALDCSEPMPPDYVTKRVAVLKEHLGIEDKHPETVAREEEALRLYLSAPAKRPPGKTGPAPKGGLAYRDIGDRLGRSERWAVMAVASALRREAAGSRAITLDFDGSILALRKFTSSELLDAGFNVSMVAQRQGHGPQVLTKHYSKGRRSADRKAAEHLGRVVHQGVTPLAVADRAS